ncbi:gp53-like domain-containing protein [Achromobacter aegrifaciens]|uniref:Putative tail fiber protein gp53-like C-terminal domain-containing protein n=1 Tax=Achromobacter aegrifaciens TaxID=1287736 RepID=A0AAD2IZ26_ACHAE|nr:hypothetical protein [Achromobacter aegrifaciens]CUJ00120.1 Uncharacterised protein [Achromobacter aegrifaciens]
MQTSNAPTKSAVPFADSGTKNAIPVASQIGVTPGAASFTDGFPPLTMTPLAAGGVPPYGADFNGILNFLSAATRWNQAGASYRYDATFASSIGGYPKGAVLSASLGNSRWLNLQDNNVTDPDGGGTGWISLGAGLASAPEVIAGVDDTKAVTPAGLAQLTSTFLRRGLVRLATDTETAAGTDFSIAVSPGALSARNATDTRTGLIKVTTSALAQGLVNDDTAITPKKLADAFKGANWNASSPGYVRLPNGMILQWGSAAGFNSYNVVFPIAFPSGPLMAPLAVCIGPDDYDAPNAAWAEASNFPTPTTCKIFVYKPGPTGGAVSTAQAICWFCIGI